MATIPISGTLEANGPFPIATGDFDARSVRALNNTPARTVVYVRTAGNDTTGDGKAVGTAFRTLQKALDSIPLVSRGSSYAIDITGINDAGQVDLPPYISAQPLDFFFGGLDMHYYEEGYVNVMASPTVLATLNAGTTSTVLDSISVLMTITDSSKTWTVNQWKGKLVFGSGSPFAFGVVKSNTATQLVISAGGAMSGTFTICDYGATLTGITAGPYTVGLEGVRAAVVFSGIKIVHPDQYTPSVSGQNVSQVQFIACDIKNMNFDANIVKMSGCYFHGEATPNSQNDVTLFLRQFSLFACFLEGIQFFADCMQMSLTFCRVSACEILDTRGIPGAQVDLSACAFDTYGITVSGGYMWNIANTRVDGAQPQGHTNVNGSGIVAYGGATINFGEGSIGGSGNAGAGLELVAGAQAYVESTEPVTFSITGTMGDLKVGSMPVRTWADFAANFPIAEQTDLTHLSRIGSNVSDSLPMLFRETPYSTVSRPTTNLVAGSKYWDTTRQQIMVWNGSAWGPVGGVASSMISVIQLGLQAVNDSATPQVVGGATIDPSQYVQAGTTLSIKFVATAACGNTPLTGHVKLHNITDNVDVATADFVNNTDVQTINVSLAVGNGGAGQMPNSAKIYAVLIYVNAPALPIDTIQLYSAGIVLTNTVS